MEKNFYTEKTVVEKFKMDPENLIIYKTLLGDNSDKVKGVKGLGEKGLYKRFPELSKGKVTLDDIYDICEKRFNDHQELKEKGSKEKFPIVYARIIQHIEELRTNYKIMDLSNPMLDSRDKTYLDECVKTNEYQYLPDQFVSFYNEDKLGGMIRNVEFWVKDVFEKIKL